VTLLHLAETLGIGAEAEKNFWTKFTGESCQGCYRYFPKVSPIFDIDTGFKSIVDTDIDTSISILL